MQTKELIFSSREIALEMGYDHISTIHFLIADCAIEYPLSIRNYCFPNKEDYFRYKKENTKENNSIVEKITESLPLTKEAELALRQAELKRSITNQQEILPHHIFLAAFENKDSVLSQVFMETPDLLFNLKKFYLQKGAFEIDLIPLPEIRTNEEKTNKKKNPVKKFFKNILTKIGKFFL